MWRILGGLPRGLNNGCLTGGRSRRRSQIAGRRCGTIYPVYPMNNFKNYSQSSVPGFIIPDNAQIIFG